MYFGWKPYVPVAQRRREAAQQVSQMKKNGRTVAPVAIEGRTIAASFWGKSWCTNLERYSDYANRLPRGRSYVRNGSVVDLQIASGEVTALVSGSELYKIKITIAPVKPDAWKSICRDCAGTVSSLVELLQGRIAKSVMDRVCRQGDGLFPAPKDIKLSCSCPDWASMCKHVAATLYGVGARLDSRPELMFVLRGVDSCDLLSAGPRMTLSGAPGAAKVLDDGDVGALFGLEMADGAGETGAAVFGGAGAAPAPVAAGTAARSRRLPAAKAVAPAGRGGTAATPVKTKTRAAAEGKAPSPGRTKGEAAASKAKQSRRNGTPRTRAPVKPAPAVATRANGGPAKRKTRTADVAAHAGK